MSETALEEDAGKRDRGLWGYGRARSDAVSCKTCRYSYGPFGERRCRLLKGFIYMFDTCDLWEARKL